MNNDQLSEEQIKKLLEKEKEIRTMPEDLSKLKGQPIGESPHLKGEGMPIPIPPVKPISTEAENELELKAKPILEETKEEPKKVQKAAFSKPLYKPPTPIKKPLVPPLPGTQEYLPPEVRLARATEPKPVTPPIRPFPQEQFKPISEIEKEIPSPTPPEKEILRAEAEIPPLGAEPPPPKRGGKLKFILIIIFIIATLVVASRYLTTLKPSNTPQQPPSGPSAVSNIPSNNTPQTPTPTPLIEGLASLQINLSSPTDGNLLTNFYRYLQTNYLNKNIALPQMAVANIRIGNDWLNFNQLEEKLNINFPGEVKSTLSQDFSLLLFSEDTNKNLRLAIIIKTNDASLTSQKMRDWENAVIGDITLGHKTMVENLKSLFLVSSIKFVAGREFSTNVYRQITIRYLNLADPETTIDYIILDDKLIITTSRESMYAVIDKLKK